MIRVCNSGLQVDALSDELRARISLLDDDELAVLESVKAKLNSGLGYSLSINYPDVIGTILITMSL